MANLTRIYELAAQLSLNNLATKNIPLDVGDKELNFLEYVLATEQAIRDDKKYLFRKSRSKLPDKMLLENFDFTFQPNITKWHVEQLEKLDWLVKNFNILIIGDAGTGKTHMAAAIGNSALWQGKKVFYATIKEILFIFKTQDSIRFSKGRVNYIRECQLVILDELGYLPMEREDALLLYKLINEINAVTSLIIVTNREFEMWHEIFCDEIIAATILDRLIANCQVMKFSGRSYRLAKHMSIFKE